MLHCLLLPGDEPPRQVALKRLLLLADTVSIAGVDDDALLLDGEVVENFPGMGIRWAKRAPFPRVEHYDERLAELLAETVTLQKRGAVRVLPSRAHGTTPIARIRAQRLLLAQETLVRSAIPDYEADLIPHMPIKGVIFGAEIAPTGKRSQYSFEEAKPAASIPGISDAWLCAAQLRLGRAAKYFLTAQLGNMATVADDIANISIAAALVGQGLDPVMSGSDVIDLGIASDEILAVELESALADVPWADVIALRREVLPEFGRLRQELRRRVGPIYSKVVGPGDYVSALAQIRAEYDDVRKAHDEAFEKLTIALKIRGVASAGTFLGLNAISPPVPGLDLLIGILVLGLAAGKTMATELRDLHVTHRKLQTHPFTIIRNIPRAVVAAGVRQGREAMAAPTLPPIG